MSLIRSLATGASALRAHQKGFDVISNNLANANTLAYKSSKANFAEQFNQIYDHGTAPGSAGSATAGGTNPIQFGLGVKLSSIQQNMSQGMMESTNRPLDIALRGNGYFIYNLNGQDYYSRAGAVSSDKAGNLVDSGTGAHLRGYNVAIGADGRPQKDSNGANILDATPSNLTISPDTISTPKQTSGVTLKGNLNVEAKAGNKRTTSINVIDNVGGSHSLSFTFTKGAAKGDYDVTAEIDGKKLTLSAAQIKFNDDGSLKTPMELDVTAADINSALGTTNFDATTPKDIKIKLADPNNLLLGLTNLAQADSATAAQQDGYKIGTMQGINVGPDGKIIGSFSNGQSEVLGQVVIAKFTNDEGLVRNGSNLLSASPNSGLPVVGTAGDIFPSTLVSGATLESSNVDMTTEFTNMITTQRAFEAASRTVTVSDQLLQDITSLKR